MSRFPDTFQIEKLPPLALAKVRTAIDLLQPSKVVLIGGSDETIEKLRSQAVDDGEFTWYNQDLAPDCTAFCSGEDDAARVPVKYVLRDGEPPIGSHNSGINEERFAADKLRFEGDMAGKTMYIVPWRACHHESPLTMCGILVTDSAALAHLTLIMMRGGVVSTTDPSFQVPNGFFFQIVSKSDHKPESRIITLDRINMEIWCRAYDYPGATLGKKNATMRLAGLFGLMLDDDDRQFIVEHAAIIKLVSPENVSSHVLFAADSGCGKTDMATTKPPEHLTALGWLLKLVGDDQCWMKVVAGVLIAANTEAGTFGVASDTNKERSPNVWEAISRGANFLNLGRSAMGEPLWKGDGRKRMPGDKDWLGRPSDGKKAENDDNGRFAVSLERFPNFDPFAWKKGVSVDHYMLGVRRYDTIPLLRIARNWEEFLFYYATMIGEGTSAEKGALGKLKHNPGATLPFLAYPAIWHIDQLRAVDRQLGQQPVVGSLINVFRKRKDGSFVFPGYREKVRLLISALDVQYGRGEGVPVPTGLIPARDAIDLTGLDVDYEELFHIDTGEMRVEYERYEEALGKGLEAPKDHFLWKVFHQHRRELGL